jgi:hypothetical protein
MSLPVKKVHRLPSWLIGIVAGDLFWASALFGFYALQHLGQAFRMGWPDLFATLGLICSLVALPIGLGGWYFIWGDNGPPYECLKTWPFNIGFGLIFYGLLGAVAGLAGRGPKSKMAQ